MNRYDRRPDQQYDDYGNDARQSQQWDQTASQAGETADYDRDARNRSRYENRGYGDFDRGNRQSPMGEQNRYHDSDNRDRYDQRRGARISERYERDSDRGYGRFTGDSYGGRDYADTSSSYYGSSFGVAPLGMGSAGMGYAAGGYRSDRGYDQDRYSADRRGDHDRGFLERAGDEIASWFGDNDAARRREQDHRGSGPQNYARSDERILDDVCDRLTEDRYVDARDITVTVQEREVTLDGTVSSKAAKRRAEDCADHVSGVKHVQNNLRVSERQETGTRQSTDTSSGIL